MSNTIREVADVLVAKGFSAKVENRGNGDFINVKTCNEKYGAEYGIKVSLADEFVMVSSDYISFFGEDVSLERRIECVNNHNHLYGWRFYFCIAEEQGNSLRLRTVQKYFNNLEDLVVELVVGADEEFTFFCNEYAEGKI